MKSFKFHKVLIFEWLVAWYAHYAMHMSVVFFKLIFYKNLTLLMKTMS